MEMLLVHVFCPISQVIKKNSIAVKVIKRIKGKKNPNDQIEAN